MTLHAFPLMLSLGMLAPSLAVAQERFSTLSLEGTPRYGLSREDRDAAAKAELARQTAAHQYEAASQHPARPSDAPVATSLAFSALYPPVELDAGPAKPSATSDHRLASRHDRKKTKRVSVAKAASSPVKHPAVHDSNSGRPLIARASKALFSSSR